MTELQEKEELQKLLDETTTVLGGTDQTYIQLLQMLNAAKKLMIIHRLLPGLLVFFKYKPLGTEYKKGHKYYDKYPLVLITDTSITGFEGINLHYIDPDNRNFLFQSMMRGLPVIHSGLEWKDRLMVDYDRLKFKRAYRFFRPCYRKYTWKGIQRLPVVIPHHLWGDMILSNTMRFIEKKPHTVYRESYLDVIRRGK
jgi:hypothetical protein